MGMKALVSELVGLGFEIIDDLAPPAVFTRNVYAYDAATGTTVGTPTNYPIDQAIETRFAAHELGGDVNVKTDARLIIYAPQLEVEPEENDIITVAGVEAFEKTKIWNVKKLMSVPGRSVWIIHVTLA